jgi:hypothetical protein
MRFSNGGNFLELNKAMGYLWLLRPEGAPSTAENHGEPEISFYLILTKFI